MSPLAVHWGAQQKLLTPWLREGLIITLISCREQRESKAARIIENGKVSLRGKGAVPPDLVPSHISLCVAALAEATGDRCAHLGRERTTSVTEYVTKST